MNDSSVCKESNSDLCVCISDAAVLSISSLFLNNYKNLAYFDLCVCISESAVL